MLSNVWMVAIDRQTVPQMCVESMHISGGATNGQIRQRYIILNYINYWPSV